MKQITTDLNVSDTAILIDLLIENSRKCESVTTAQCALELINKVTDIHNQVKGDTSRKHEIEYTSLESSL